jgi:CRISPR type IV-associated protein Csf2
MNRIRISGTLTTLAQLHITAPSDGSRWNPEAAPAYRKAKSRRGFPLTVTRTTTFNLGVDAASEGHSAFVAEIPVIPASTLRGRLRRLAADVVIDAIGPVSARLYHILRMGAATGDTIGKQVTNDIILGQRENPILGLFGGGPNLIAGRLGGADALPYIGALREAGIVNDHPAQDLPLSAVRDLIAVAPVIRKDDLADAADPVKQTRQVIDYATARTEMLEAIAANTKQKDLDTLRREIDKLDRAGNDDEARAKRAELREREAEDQERSSNRHISFIEYVAPNTDFSLDFVLNDPTDAQLGLFVRALEAFIADGYTGGKSELGWGRFAARNLRLDAGENQEPIFSGAKLASGPIVARALKALDDELASLTPEALEKLLAA